MDLKILRTRVGLAIVNAAVDDDVIGLVLMSVSFALAIKGMILHEAVFMPLFSSIAFITFDFVISRYVSKHTEIRLIVDRYLKSTSSRLALAITLAFAFGLLAKIASLHEIIGVFIAGMLLRGLLTWKVESEIFDFTFAFFALLFFSYVGVKTDLRIIAMSSDLVLAILIAAFVGKILGGFIGAKISKFSNGEALIVGVTMNGRAAVELAIANAYYALGVFTAELFSAIVLMATVTSLTTPLLLRLVVKYVATP